MMEFLDIAWEDFTSEYMLITFLVFLSLWLFYFFPRILPKAFYGMYRKEYVSKDEKEGISFIIEPTDPYKGTNHSPFKVSKCIYIDIGLEDYLFKRRYRDMRFEKAMGLPYWFKVLGGYRKLSISNIEENINSALSINEENLGLILGINNLDINKVEVRFKLNSFIHSCYLNHKPIDTIVNDMVRWVHKVNEFQDHKVMSTILREYGHVIVKYEGKVIETYNRCFEIIKVTDRDQ